MVSPPSIHEDFSQNEKPPELSDRNFGLAFCVILLAVGLRPLLGGHGPRIWALILSMVFLIFSAVCPAWLNPLNRGWVAVTRPIGQVTNTLILGITFYGIFTPAATLFRFFRKEPLSVRYDPHRGSYWVKRTPPGPEGRSMRFQF